MYVHFLCSVFLYGSNWSSLVFHCWHVPVVWLVFPGAPQRIPLLTYILEEISRFTISGYIAHNIIYKQLLKTEPTYTNSKICLRLFTTLSVCAILGEHVIHESSFDLRRLHVKKVQFTIISELMFPYSWWRLSGGVIIINSGLQTLALFEKKFPYKNNVDIPISDKRHT